MRIPKGLRFVPLLACAAALFLPPPGSGQGGVQDRVERHYWIVLLDVSASFESRQAVGSAGAGLPADYRLRNELLALIHSLLAARGRAEGGTRQDYLSVYFFGRGVRAADGQQMAPVSWDYAKNETWWETRQQGLSQDFRSRTDLAAALHRAVDDFQTDEAARWKKHLVVISDGELDVEPTGRNPGEPPAREEIEAYDALLTLQNPAMNWLQRNDVEIRALTVDEGLRSPFDEQRQLAIRSDLYTEGRSGNALDLARTLIHDRVSRIGQESYRSEGPAVMKALAEGAGSPSSGARSVRYDNIRDVLRETFLPGSTDGPFVAPGTRTVVVLAALGRPVVVTLDPARPPVTLTFNTTTGRPLIDDPERQVSSYDAQRSAQYVTWVVHGRNITRVDAGPEAHILSINDVHFRWRPSAPPRVTAQGQTVPLVAELVWRADSAANDLQTWRDRMRRSLNGVDATVTIAAPNAREPLRLSLRPTLQNSDSVLLILEGGYPGTQAEGVHEISGTMRVSTPDGTWEEELPSTLLEVSSQPAALPELFVVAERGGRRSERVRLDPTGVAALQGNGRGPLLLHFSTETGPGAGPGPGRAPAPEAVPDRIEISTSEGEVGRTVPVRAEPVAGGSRYEFSPVALPEVSLRDTLTVRVVAGTTVYEYRVVVTRGGAGRWLWIAAALAALAAVLFLVLLAVVWQERGRGRGQIFDFVAVVDGVPQAPKGRDLVIERLPSGRVEVRKSPSGDGDAVRFSAPPGPTYRLAPTGKRTDWQYRRVRPGPDADALFRPLHLAGDNGLRRRDVLDGWRFEIRHGEHVVEIRSQQHAPLRPEDALTRTLT